MKNTEVAHTTIKDLPVEMRPRERLISRGASHLSDVELLAIILSTGTKGRSALEISQKLLQFFRNFGRMGNAGVEELASSTGIGRAKAAKILAGIEIGRRMSINAHEKKITISNCESVAQFLMPSMRYLEKEYFKAIVLNTKNQLIKLVDVAIGSLNGAIIHPRELYRLVIKEGGAGVIVAHNHPSGDATPSRDDIDLTKRLAEVGRIIGIELVDHVIIGDGSYVSLKEMKYI